MRFRLALLAAVAAVAAGSGRDVAVDTGAVASFGAAGDSAGTFWVALGWPDNKLQVFRSTDDGQTWRSALWFALDGTARQIEMVATAGDSGFVFVFFLSSAGDGDLWLCRVRPATLAWDTVPVAAGPDTIDDFSVTVDRDSNYWLYCLYVNEQRGGLNGRFTRSFDSGRTWEFNQDWWNASDPDISAGSGSTIHAVWIAGGREVHYCANRHYGRSGRWESHHVLKSGGPLCWDPVVAEADTFAEYGRAVWAVYTVARRDSQLTDLEYSRSPNGGWSWQTGFVLGEPLTSEWGADLKADPRVAGFVDLCYNSAPIGPNEPVKVIWRCAHAADPDFWTDPFAVTDGRATALVSGTRPRIAAAAVHAARGPAVFFSLHRPGGPDGVWFDAPWRPFQGSPIATRTSSLAPRHSLARAAGGSLVTSTATVCDAAGRVVRTLDVEPGASRVLWDGRDPTGAPAPAGTYFIVYREGPDVRRCQTLRLWR